MPVRDRPSRASGVPRLPGRTLAACPHDEPNRVPSRVNVRDNPATDAKDAKLREYQKRTGTHAPVAMSASKRWWQLREFRQLAQLANVVVGGVKFIGGRDEGLIGGSRKAS